MRLKRHRRNPDPAGEEASASPPPSLYAGALMPSLTVLVRVAREDVLTGQFAALADAATLVLSDVTCTICQSGGSVILHQPLGALVFGSLDSKIMLVPASRGPALLAECHAERDVAVVLQHLRFKGMAINGPPPPAYTHTPPAQLDVEIERFLENADFLRLLSHLEGTLARRHSLGLPEPLPPQ